MRLVVCGMTYCAPLFVVMVFLPMQQLLSDRADCVAEILETICEADLFIFTLGLTEAWRPKWSDLSIMPWHYLRGFNDQEYQFHNFSYEELLATF